ncbi:DUF4190 domain-containing protein [Microbacterium sp. VKM Ac-2870]|uniref:DUF4190 domain-containing protein n=1 Tax=Microbacterium sp. VKM Ac-2870 TaxID=2783825 RepID=UPI00188AEC30|nr:DUF4190 domain-containing protein [Microbacterium sp. VKM Ac-2870]MBF4562505.1 DUF4190 domain-containing protein [Microbacterium sp. VKM Ac-2870]
MDESDSARATAAAAETPNLSAPRLPFSQMAIWGFVISCASLFVFGFLGTVGAIISAQGVKAATRGLARGKGLGLAGFFIGAAAFLYWAITYMVTLSH